MLFARMPLRIEFATINWTFNVEIFNKPHPDISGMGGVLQQNLLLEIREV